ncbi:chloroplastic group IIA intron splicing facilitator CRS1, chloroplastic isoform X2 [Magnolia sinica]|uniref:chloroplastic group IIA intron splicing facilitator CRS1, chloroplastic isoform X2 n=1 Tax=Magnolia sinica TaxID=86752 RepID=UPI002657FF2B|nr:chloroplastic group IIA intron splicing facilitator CRS1, chloroplastic isoform X2 [Magnolia sinica]
MPSSLPLSPHLAPSNGPYPPHTSTPPPSNCPNTTTHIHFPLPPSFPKTPIKVPTPPWIKGPLLLPPEKILDLSQKSHKNHTRKPYSRDRSLTEKVRGGRGRQAMKKILESIAKLQEFDASDGAESPAIESGFEFEVPLGEQAEDEDGRSGSNEGGKMPWARAEKIVFWRVKKERVATKAELSLSEAELVRLRREAVKIRKWIKVKKVGVSLDVVDEIRKTWRESELVMLKFDLPLCRNMDRAREIIETKTGGLVVWSKKDMLVVYRGNDYQITSKSFPKHSALASVENFVSRNSEDRTTIFEDGMVDTSDTEEDSNSPPTGLVMGIDSGAGLIDGTLFEREANRLLDGLGPRFVDWWWSKPLPVDADLLPEVVPGFRPPCRLCPPRMRPKLTDDELTYLRKLARPLPTHFVLGRNTRFQGLAAAILKLWEKSLIVKIAVKWGIPNTNNAQMAWELKRLTGGVLILRNKFFIILYRGKDFLPRSVANMIAEREIELKTQQLAEENARLKAVESFRVSEETSPSTRTSGTFSEFHDIQTKRGHPMDRNWEIKVRIEAEKDRLEKELRKQEHKLLILKLKTERSEKQLAKLNSSWSPADAASDQEMLTEEERQILRNIGLKMDEILLLGRRGIYDGIIGSIHQHWKHREVVKVVSMQKSFSQVMNTAILLEIESGGILVFVEKLRKGHAIIIYRGKNYRRPVKLLPENLLTKKEALQRSIEMQRRGCLKYFAYQRQRTIWNLKHKLI